MLCAYCTVVVVFAVSVWRSVWAYITIVYVCNAVRPIRGRGVTGMEGIRARRGGMSIAMRVSWLWLTDWCARVGEQQQQQHTAGRTVARKKASMLMPTP